MSDLPLKTPATPSKHDHPSPEELNRSARRHANSVLLSRAERSERDVSPIDIMMDQEEEELAEKILEISSSKVIDLDGDYNYENDTTPSDTPSKGKKKQSEELDEESVTSTSTRGGRGRGRGRGRGKGRGGTGRASKTATDRNTSGNNSLQSTDIQNESDDDYFESKNQVNLEYLFVDGFEGYFDQHKTREHGSNTPFSHAPRLEFNEFINYIEESRNFNKDAREYLFSLYKKMYQQWYFELSQGYSLLFYGLGSKHNLLVDFVTSTIPEDVPIFVINGFNPSLSFKEILNALVPILLPNHDVKKFPKHTPDLLHTVLHLLDEESSAMFSMIYEKQKLQQQYVFSDDPDAIQNVKISQAHDNDNADDSNTSTLPNTRRIYSKPSQTDDKDESTNVISSLVPPRVVIVLHNIDGESLRDMRTQNYLARLISAKQIWFVTSADNINTPFLWDVDRTSLYNFIWHDTTTFESYANETSFDDPLTLGTTRNAAKSKGLKFILSSVTSNARELYKALIHLQLEKLDRMNLPSSGDGEPVPGNLNSATPLQTLYDTASAQFSVSNEVNFRTMLTEFIDHKMLTLTKDQAGVDVVFIPYDRDTIEQILEDGYLDD